MEIRDHIFLIVVIHEILFGAVCFFIGRQRDMGAIAAAFLGLLLGIIGLIIVLCAHGKPSIYFAEEVRMYYKSLFESGTISKAEYKNLKSKFFEQR